MSHDPLAKFSKFLSFVLRHEPDAIGLGLDEQGWASVDELLAKAAAAGTALSRETLLRVVETNDKKRFTLSVDQTRIRAAQGHSVTVELALQPSEPPPVLFHGTATRFVDAILTEGVLPMSRQHVHLSSDEATARNVGQRHGKPVVLVVQAGRMHQRGLAFFLAENGVWLTDRVPPEFLARSTAPAAQPPA